MSTDHPLPANDNGAVQRSEFSFWELAAVVLKNRWLIIGLAVALGAFGAIRALRTPRTYTATAAFVPREVQSSGGISSIAQRVGLQVNAGSDRSPEYYAELITSREVLRGVARTRFDRPGGTSSDSAALPEILNYGPLTDRKAVAETVDNLRDAAEVTTSRATGVTRVSVTAADPGLAAAIAARLLQGVDAFNAQQRHAQASAERQFIEGRLREARAELREAEDRLLRFLQTNRLIANSPELIFTRDRLEREVAMRDGVYTSLVQAGDQARIEEARNLPVIMVLERPDPPLRPNARGTVRNTLILTVVGLVLGIMLAFARELWRQSRERRTPEFVAFEQLIDETKREIRYPVKRIGSAFQRR
jgi:uncharacterized protein involved in exopolysaccharide biosynthesis